MSLLTKIIKFCGGFSKEEMSAKEAEISVLKSNISALNSTITKLEEEIKRLESEVVSLATQLATKESTKTKLYYMIKNPEYCCFAGTTTIDRDSDYIIGGNAFRHIYNIAWGEKVATVGKDEDGRCYVDVVEYNEVFNRLYTQYKAGESFDDEYTETAVKYVASNSIYMLKVKESEKAKYIYGKVGSNYEIVYADTKEPVIKPYEPSAK